MQCTNFEELTNKFFQKIPEGISGGTPKETIEEFFKKKKNPGKQKLTKKKTREGISDLTFGDVSKRFPADMP